MVIDSHCHILPPDFAARHALLCAADATFAALFPSSGFKLATAETLVADLARSGIDLAVAAGFGWVDLATAREANDYTIEAARRWPQQIAGFCSVNPAWGAPAVAEMERCASAGLRGVGELHPDTQGIDIIDKRLMAPVMDAARRLGWPVLLHASEPVGHQYPGKGAVTPDKTLRFIENFPDNVIVCAHWGGGLPFYVLMPEVAAALENVYFDSAASPFLYRPGVFAAVAGLVGSEKVLFATDYPLLRHRRVLRQVKESGLDAAAQAAILGGNMARILKLSTDGG